MKISLTLLGYLAKQIDKGNIVNALLWANEYRQDSPELVAALVKRAGSSWYFNTLSSEVKKSLINGFTAEQFASQGLSFVSLNKLSLVA
jgi:hypothetical protein